MSVEKKRVPIFNGYVEITKEKYDKLVADGELEAFQRLYDPKHVSPTTYTWGCGMVRTPTLNGYKD